MGFNNTESLLTESSQSYTTGTENEIFTSKDEPDISASFELIKSEDYKHLLEKYSQSNLNSIGVIEILCLGEEFGQIGKEEITSAVRGIFEKEMKSNSISLDSYRERIKEGGDDSLNNGMANLYENYVKAYQAEFAKAESNPNHWYEWFLNAKQTILETKTEVLNYTDRLSTLLTTLFGPYVTEEVKDRYSNLVNLVVPVTRIEFDKFCDVAFGWEADEFQFKKHSTAAFNTRTRYEKPRAVVQALNFFLKVSDNQDPNKGISFSSFLAKEKSILTHEILHKITDFTLKTEQHPQFLIDERGFRKNYYDPLTKEPAPHSRADRENYSIETSFDEGTVTFFQLLIVHKGDHAKVHDFLTNTPFLLDSAYTSMAREISQLAQEIGIPAIADAYINCSLDKLISRITEEKGEIKTGEFIARMADCTKILYKD